MEPWRAMLTAILAAHLVLAAGAPPAPSSITLSPEEAEAAAAASREENQRQWYGWETLFTDGLSVACLAGSAASSGSSPSASPVLLLGGLALYSFGGPLMHLRHDRWNTGLIDVGVRVVLPGALVSLALVSGALGSGWNQLTAAPFAIAAGGLIAMGVDAFGLAWEPPPSARPAHASIQWAPFAGALRGAPMAGLAGAF